MFDLKTMPMAGQFENHVGTYSVFLQHIQQPLIWLVCIDHQLPEEVFKMINFVAALILVDLSSKQQISLLPVILAPHDEDSPRFHTSDGHSSVEDICRFLLLSQIAPFKQELHLSSFQASLKIFPIFQLEFLTPAFMLSCIVCRPEVQICINGGSSFESLFSAKSSPKRKLTFGPSEDI